MTERLANLDPMILAAVLVLLLAVAIVGIGLVNSLYGPRARLERRLKNVGEGGVVLGGREKGGKGAAQTGMKRKDIEAKLKAAEQIKGRQRGYKLREKLIQAGLKTSPKRFYMWSVVSGVICAVLVLPFGLPAYVPLLAFMVGLLGMPRFILNKMVARRIKKFTSSFAEAIDLIVRGVRTGMTVSECLGIVGREMPDPIGAEFRTITEGLSIGLTLDDVMERFTGRVPSSEARFFSIVLVTQQTTGGNLAETLAKLAGILRDRKRMRDKIRALSSEARFFSIVLVTQQTTGGNLAETLAKLAGILRDRKRMRDKIRALSSEAKSSAGIIGSLPFAVGGILTFIAPDYIAILFTTSAGNWLVFAGFCVMSTGILVMRKMINFEI